MTGIDLVTGGCGFIGRHLVAALQARGRAVRVLDTAPLPDGMTGIDHHRASILDVPAVDAAVAGAERVFHVAGDPSLWARGGKAFDRTNRSGAETVIDAAVEAGASRIVLTSSHAIDVKGRPTETAMPGPYTRAKFRAEQFALRRVGEGAPVIAVAPTMPLGPGDRNLTPPTRMLLEFLQGKNPAFLDFEVNLIDVREVAEGHVLAAERGEAGVRYVLGRHNLMLSDMLAMVERISGRAMPKRTIPYALAWASAAVMEAGALITRKPPRASLEGVRLARRLMPVADDPAAVLGLPEWPLEAMLRDAIGWLEEERHWRRDG
ncbi:MAG: NAD-dependent epimerase/dehydratase family protein [Minwuia sp.]|uniref:NAD-dependent epimerase/dehydratase family protein n=1 Tax=Minwuia sp. TaxID=2493630 RepID=UPI003A839A38